MEQLIDRIAKAPPALKYGGLAAVVVVATLLNYLLVIQPLDDETTGLRNKQVMLAQQLAEKQEIAQNLAERRKEMDQLEQQLAEARTELPERKDVEELLAQLNDIGKKSGLEISRVEPMGEAPAGFVSAIPIKVEVTGNYHEVAMFMQEISNMRRIVNVNNIRFGSSETKSEKVVLNTHFMATTFRFVEPAQGQVQK